MKLPPALTARQRQVLEFMHSFFEANDQLPPMRAISQHFGWKSDNAAVTFAAILEAKGYIEKNEVGRYRFTRNQPVATEVATLPGALLRLPVHDSIPVRRFVGA